MNVYETSPGIPLTEDQRAARHFERTGETVPPPRGTGRRTGSARTSSLTTDSTSNALLWITIGLSVAALAGQLYLVFKK